MDPPLITDASFSAANPSSYSLAEIWPFSVNGSVAVDESTVTEQSGSRCGGGRKRRGANSEDESSKVVSTTSSCNDLNNSNGKRMKISGSRDENGGSKSEDKPSEPPKQDFIHVRARRGQATDNHSLAERARREKISERMKTLQDLVPGCNKIIGKAIVLDEIINYVQSLQCQVEFLSMKLEAVNSTTNSPIDGFHSKDLGPTLDATGMIFGSQATREHLQGSQPEWLHMQIGNSFDRET